MANKPVKNEKQINSFWTVWNIVEALILLAAGVISIVFGCLNKQDDGFKGNMNMILTYSVASFVILDGLLRIIMSFLKEENRTEEPIMLVGGFEITLGIVIMVVLKEVFIPTMVYFMAIGMMVIGLLFLIFSVLTLAKKTTEKYFMPILEIVFGAILVGVGVFLVVVYNVSQEAGNRISLILTGSVLSIAAIAQISLVTISAVKRGKKNSDKKGDDEDKSEKEEEPVKKNKPAKETVEVIETEEVKEIESTPVKQIENKDKEGE